MNPSQTAASPAQAQLATKSKPTAGGAPFSSPHLYYEPTSVLEPHHLDSSPASADANAGAVACWDQKPPKYALTPPAAAEDWDPLSCWLLDKDAVGPGELDYDGEIHHPAPPHHFPFDNADADPFDFLAPPFGGVSEHLLPFAPSHPQPAAPPPAFEQFHLDQLLRAAYAVETGDRSGGCAILARLNHNLPAPAGRPFQRAAFYFKDALHSLLLDDTLSPAAGLSPVEVVRRIAAYKALCDLSPVPQFVAFTANQTVLEALFRSSNDGGVARPLHIVDLDVGLGGHWASFTHDFATHCRLRLAAPPPVRITAVIQDETLETRLVAQNLREFAAAVGVRLAFDVVVAAGPNALGAVRLTPEETLAVTFSPSVSRLLGGGRGAVESLLRFVRSASPKVTVFVDESGPPQQFPHSFRTGFIAGLQYYSVVLESLDAAAGPAASETVRRIERALVQPRVREAVRTCRARPVRWREQLQAAGLRPMAFSDRAVSQAEGLIRRFPAGGYRVATCDGALVLAWKDMEIAATSAWHCHRDAGPLN